MEETINRYGRQELIEGWNQDKLKRSHIAIVGAGHIGNFLAADLCALGVGQIRLYDDSRAEYSSNKTPYKDREFLISGLSEGKSKVEALEKKLLLINPNSECYALQMQFDDITANLIEKPDILVTAVNDKDVVKSYWSYCRKNKVPMYCAFSDINEGYFSLYNPKLPDFSMREQEAINSEIISGLLASEILQKIMYNNSIDTLSYKQFINKDFKSKPEKDRLKQKSALVVGAGALGNFLGIGLTHAGIGTIYLVDDDSIETTNLNRQILFYGSVGKKKVKTLADRLMEINPDVDVKSIEKRVDENFETHLRRLKPDILIDCVDNLATRAILNHYAIRNNIPLISGGTDYAAGQVVVYEKGYSECLNCRLNVDEALLKARASHSCIHAPTPSVVITNHIIGGIMASQARIVLDHENYGESSKKTIKYDSTKKARLGYIGSSDSCNCEREESAPEWLENLAKKSKEKKNEKVNV